MNYGNPPPPMNVPPGYGPQPYAPPPKKGMSTGKILAIIFGSLGGVALLCCGGCGAIFMFGMNEMEKQVADKFRTDPVVQEHLGGITDIDYALMKSGEESQKGNQAMVFEVKGPKGSGTLVVQQTPAGGVGDAVLRVGGGEYPLGVTLDDGSTEPDSFD